MNARSIAEQLGKARREGRGWRTRCPIHGGFSLNLANGSDNTLLVHCWAGCPTEDILEELRRLDLDDDDDDGWSTDELEEHRESQAGPRTLRAKRLWERARPANGTPVEVYLRSRRIALPVPPTLRWLPSCKHGPTGTYLPAIVAKVVDADGRFIAAHRTFLLPDGTAKAAVDKDYQRMSLGSTRGGVVRLAPYDGDRALIIGEGIETVLSLMQLRGLPGWASVSSSILKYLVLPPAVRRVLIAVDHDRHGVGERSARAAGQRWVAEGREVRLTMPEQSGTDWNDVLQRGVCNA
jgi:putative DNA primase/helicase